MTNLISILTPKKVAEGMLSNRSRNPLKMLVCWTSPQSNSSITPYYLHLDSQPIEGCLTMSPSVRFTNGANLWRCPSSNGRTSAPSSQRTTPSKRSKILKPLRRVKANVTAFRWQWKYLICRASTQASFRLSRECLSTWWWSVPRSTPPSTHVSSRAAKSKVREKVAIVRVTDIKLPTVSKSELRLSIPKRIDLNSESNLGSKLHPKPASSSEHKDTNQSTSSIHYRMMTSTSLRFYKKKAPQLGAKISFRNLSSNRPSRSNSSRNGYQPSPN